MDVFLQILQNDQKTNIFQILFKSTFCLVNK